MQIAYHSLTGSSLIEESPNVRGSSQEKKEEDKLGYAPNAQKQAMVECRKESQKGRKES